MNITAKVEGLRNLKGKLSQYERELKRQYGFALQATATGVRDDAKAEAPVDTANLRNSIRTDFQDLGKLYARVLTSLEYARRQEFGFTGTDALGRTYDQAGSFFMTKAAKKHRKRHERAMRAATLRARRNTFGG